MGRPVYLPFGGYRVAVGPAPLLVALAEAFASAADDNVLLDHLCGLLIDVLPIVAAGLVVVDEELRPVEVAAAPGSLRRLLTAQFAHGAGPGIEACRSGRSMIEIDHTGTGLTHWPLPPSAPPLPWRAMHTMPLRIGGRVAAAVSLASTGGSGLAEHDIAVARSISTIGAGHVLKVRSLADSQWLAGQMHDALHVRILIEQAKGMLAAQLNVSIAQASLVLRRHARNRQRRLGEAAAEVLAGSADLSFGRGDLDQPARTRMVTE